MWNLPGPGLEPVSPALAGRFTNPSSQVASEKGLGASDYLPTDLLLEALLLPLLLLFVQMGPAAHGQLLDQPLHLPALLLPLLSLQLFEAAPVVDHAFWT